MFRNIGIGARLGAGFTFLLIMICGIGAESIFQVSRLHEMTKKNADSRLPRIEVLEDIRALSNSVRGASLQATFAIDPTARQAQRVRRDEGIAKLDLAVHEYQKLISSSEEEELYHRIKRALNDYLAIDRRLIELSEFGESSFVDARALATGESADAFVSLNRLIDVDVELNRHWAAAARATSAAAFGNVVLVTSALIAVASALGICIAISLTRSITVPPWAGGIHCRDFGARLAIPVEEAILLGLLTSASLDSSWQVLRSAERGSISHDYPSAGTDSLSPLPANSGYRW